MNADDLQTEGMNEDEILGCVPEDQPEPKVTDCVEAAPEVGAEVTHQPTSMAEYSYRVNNVNQQTFRKGPETPRFDGDQRREINRHLTIIEGEAARSQIKEMAEYFSADSCCSSRRRRPNSSGGWCRSCGWRRRIAASSSSPWSRM